MPGAEWFAGTSLNYAEHVFAGKDDAETAILHASELRELGELSWGELRAQVAARRRRPARARGRARRPRRRLPAEHPRGDRRLPRHRLASAPIWSSCSPDFGPASVDRPLRPDRAQGALRGRRLPLRRQGLRPPRRSSPSCRRRCRACERTVVLPYLDPEPDLSAAARRDPLGRAARRRRGRRAQLRARPLRPPALGPLLLRHHRPAEGDRPGPGRHPARAPEEAPPPRRRPPRRPPLLVHDDRLDDVELPRLRPADPGGDRPLRRQPRPPRHGRPLGPRRARRGHDVRHQRLLHRRLHEGRGRARRRAATSAASSAVGSTGSPLSPEGFDWIYEHLGADTWLFSTSGGTDLCTAFVGGVAAAAGLPRRAAGRGRSAPRSRPGTRTATPVDRRGRRAGRHRADALDAGPLLGRRGRQPLPRQLLRACTPGVWRHGDWIEITSRGTAVIYGRSDSTINRSGIRMGTSEIYRAVLGVDEIVDALVVDVPRPGTEGWMPLFVVLREGAELDDELRERDRPPRPRAAARRATSPTRSSQIAEVPRTLSGKVLEVPVKRILMGTPAEKAASRDSLANPAALDYFTELAARLDGLSPAPSAPPAGRPQHRQHREAPAGGDEDAAERRRSGSASASTTTEQPTASDEAGAERGDGRAPAAAGTTKAKAIAIEAAAVVWPLGKAIAAELVARRARDWKRGMGEQRPSAPAWSGWRRRPRAPRRARRAAGRAARRDPAGDARAATSSGSGSPRWATASASESTAASPGSADEPVEQASRRARCTALGSRRRAAVSSDQRARRRRAHAASGALTFRATAETVARRASSAAAQAGVTGLRRSAKERSLPAAVGEAADQLGAQVLGLDHRVDDQLRGEVEDVDVRGVLLALLRRRTPRARPRPRSPGSGCRRRR